MKNKQITAVTISLLFSQVLAFAQGNREELKLSLKDAQEFAISNNKAVLSARAEIQAARMATWEVISGALPQVAATGSFTDNIRLRTVMFDGDNFGRPGEKIKFQMGTTYNSDISLQASLLLFNAPLYIGIETSKLAQKMSEQNLQKSELDTKEAVSSAYYLILVSERSLEILEKNISNLNETLKSTRAMYAAGMAEATDVDQMLSNVTMVENSKSSLLRTIELNYNLLRFQLGVPVDTKITLTETLETLTGSINVEALLSQDFDLTRNVNYMLVDNQEKMSKLNLKTQKSLVLPTLAGIYSNSQSGQGQKVPDMYWSNSSFVMAQLSIPILGSGQRYAKIRRAEIALQNAKNTTAMVSDQLKLQEKQLRYNLVNANLQYKSQKENVEVSRRVYTSMENKYRQGMASSLELTQANSLYLTAENNYVSALMNLLQTKLALDKLLNNL